MSTGLIPAIFVGPEVDRRNLRPDLHRAGGTPGPNLAAPSGAPARPARCRSDSRRAPGPPEVQRYPRGLLAATPEPSRRRGAPPDLHRAGGSRVVGLRRPTCTVQPSLLRTGGFRPTPRPRGRSAGRPARPARCRRGSFGSSGYPTCTVQVWVRESGRGHVRTTRPKVHAGRPARCRRGILPEGRAPDLHGAGEAPGSGGGHVPSPDAGGRQRDLHGAGGTPEVRTMPLTFDGLEVDRWDGWSTCTVQAALRSSGCATDLAVHSAARMSIVGQPADLHGAGGIPGSGHGRVGVARGPTCTVQARPRPDVRTLDLHGAGDAPGIRTRPRPNPRAGGGAATARCGRSRRRVPSHDLHGAGDSQVVGTRRPICTADLHGAGEAPEVRRWPRRRGAWPDLHGAGAGS